MESNNNQPQQNPALQPAQQPEPAPKPSTGKTPAGSKKPLILAAIIVGSLLVLGIVLAVVFSLTSVSKKDFQEARSAYSDVSTANYTLNSKISSLQYGLASTTDTSFSNDVDAARKAIEDVRKENDELAELKAVRVGEGKEKYEAFNEKLESYLKFSSDALTSLSDAREASVTCDKLSTARANDDSSAAVNECVAALKKVGDTPDSDIREYIKKMTTEIEKLSGLMEQSKKITDPYGRQYDEYRAIRDQLYEVQSNLNSARTDFRSNFEKHSKEVDPKKSADELSRFLTDKITE